MNFEPIKQVLANRNVVLAVVGFAAYTLVLAGGWLAAVVYAFDQGGTGETGVIAVAAMVPSGLLSPFVSVWFDRFDANRALAGGYLLQALALLASALVIAGGMSRFVVYGLLAVILTAQMSSRSTMSSILPRIVADPAQLAAANSTIGAVETFGLVAGPAAAGLLLFLTGSTTIAFVVFGAVMLTATAITLGIVQAEDPSRDGDDPDDADVTAVVTDGFRLLRQKPDVRLLVVLMSTMRLIVGVLEVGVVAIAVEHLGRDESAAGLLATAIGVGAIAGSVASFALIWRRRLTPWIVLGMFCGCLPVALIAATRETWVVLLLLGLAGLGRPILLVGGRTLLQGLSADDSLARIFGLLEGLGLLIYALGSAMLVVLAEAVNLETALIVTGGLPCVVTVALISKLHKIDQNRPTIDAELLATIRAIPIFSPLAPFRVEQMMLNMHRWTFGPNQPIFERGDQGDDLFVVTAGWAHIDLGEHPVGAGRGGFFGEIALLRDQPRIASVRAGSEGLTAYAIDRATFLSAIATAPLSEARSQQIVRQRLGESE